MTATAATLICNNDRNLELEAGVKALLEKYDQEMFDFHNKIEALEEEWGREKQQLAKVTFVAEMSALLDLLCRWRRGWL